MVSGSSGRRTSAHGPTSTTPGHYLTGAVDALRRHPDVAAAQYRHDQLRYVVTFEIQLRRRLIHPVLARRAAEDALYDTLPACGFDIGNRAMVGPNVPGTRPSHGVVAATWR